MRSSLLGHVATSIQGFISTLGGNIALYASVLDGFLGEAVLEIGSLSLNGIQFYSRTHTHALPNTHAQAPNSIFYSIIPCLFFKGSLTSE